MSKKLLLEFVCNDCSLEDNSINDAESDDLNSKIMFHRV